MPNNFESDLINNINITSNILSQQSNNNFKAQNIIDGIGTTTDITGIAIDIATASTTDGSLVIAEAFGAICEFIGGICN